MLTTTQSCRLIRHMLGFPFPRICRHTVALEVIDYMEKNGFEFPNEFVKAVVQCDDELAEKLLDDFQEKLENSTGENNVQN